MVLGLPSLSCKKCIDVHNMTRLQALGDKRRVADKKRKREVACARRPASSLVNPIATPFLEDHAPLHTVIEKKPKVRLCISDRQ